MASFVTWLRHTVLHKQSRPVMAPQAYTQSQHLHAPPTVEPTSSAQTKRTRTRSILFIIIIYSSTTPIQHMSNVFLVAILLNAQGPDVLLLDNGGRQPVEKRQAESSYSRARITVLTLIQSLAVGVIFLFLHDCQLDGIFKFFGLFCHLASLQQYTLCGGNGLVGSASGNRHKQ